MLNSVNNNFSISHYQLKMLSLQIRILVMQKYKK